jgi:tripartite-type tricarboxylate transporter receptor subunit TctC
MMAIARPDRRTTIALLASLAASPAFGQAAKRQVTLVVPFPPGGSTDALARTLVDGLQQRLGATVIVENKAGAAGALGAAQVAKSGPDASSLLVTFDSHATIPALLPRPPLNVETDLLPVLLVGTAPYVLATHPSKPYKTFADVVAAAKAKPGSVNYASAGAGTGGHLAMTLLAKRSGVNLVHVPYKGAGPGINDVVGGHVDMICASVAILLPQIAGGTLRPVMQMGKTRLDDLRDTPTGSESGFAAFEAVAWWGVFAAKDTPQHLLESTAAAIRETLSEPAISKRLRETQQMQLLLQGPAEFGAFFKGQVEEWGKVVRDNGIKAE